MSRTRIETAGRLVILLAIGGMAGAAAFTHVHDLTVAHGQPDWIGWANAVAVELMAIYLGLEIRARRRAGRPVGLVGVLLVGFALLSLSAQVAEAERSVWGWIVAAVPSLAFLALVKVVLSSTPATPNPAAGRGGAGGGDGLVLIDPAPATDLEPVYGPVSTSASRTDPARSGVSGSVLPALGVVQPGRTANGQVPQ